MPNATNHLLSPHPYTVSKGSIESGPTLKTGTSVWLNLGFNGVPTALQGAGWADIGSTGYDNTTGIWYSNQGTRLVPNWVAF